LKRRRIAKERAFVPLLGSDYGATLNTAFEEPKNSPFYLFKISPLIRTATKRTQNATGGEVRDNGFIVGLNPEAGSPEGWHWRYHRSR